MDVTQKDKIIDVEKDPFEDVPDDVVCIYPEHANNGGTVRLNVPILPTLILNG